MHVAHTMLVPQFGHNSGAGLVINARHHLLLALVCSQVDCSLPLPSLPTTPYLLPEVTVIAVLQPDSSLGLYVPYSTHLCT